MRITVEGDVFIVSNGQVESCPYDPSGCDYNIYSMCKRIDTVTLPTPGGTKGVRCKDKSPISEKFTERVVGDRTVVRLKGKHWWNELWKKIWD